MSLARMIGLDFETYGAEDLPRHGLHRYVSHHSFRPLIASGVESTGRGYYRRFRFDFVSDYEGQRQQLFDFIGDRFIVAHNAGFEQAVLASMGIDLPSNRFIDSAVVASAMGAGRKLEAAGPQLLGVDKLEDGKRLIRLFSIPGKYQEINGSSEFDEQVVHDNPEDWELFQDYCDVDAELGLRIVEHHYDDFNRHEWTNMAITMDMNRTGWPVDVARVEEMQRRYLENLEVTVQEFRDKHDAHDLNLNSLPQLKAWCLDRGVRTTSFDEKHVEKLIAQIEKKLNQTSATHPKYLGYREVLNLLHTKQALGGSSLKKLQTILDTVSPDGRLRNQYLHVGAGQTWRTTGVGVQMQNLKRLGDTLDDMAELDDLDVEWDNAKLASNLRQVFTSKDPNGSLIVGDFSSVEARGLGWLSGDTKKLDAYRQGLDMYKVLAADMYGVRYEDVTKAQRQGGKVGVLSCGYQAGGGAVQAFAAKMGIELTEAEATKIVSDWRGANPLVVDLWDRLDEALNTVLDGPQQLATIKVGPTQQWRVRVYRCDTPQSLLDQHPGATSIAMELMNPWGETVLTRYFHGCYRRGKDICYYKPSKLKSGDLWSSHFTDPKTKQVRFYNIYGGKLTGILTQSFCREIFFRSLRSLAQWVETVENVELIGQFHDEIVLDWVPGTLDREAAIFGMKGCMSDAGDIKDFPLEADIKYDYRYTK